MLVIARYQALQIPSIERGIDLFTGDLHPESSIKMLGNLTSLHGSLGYRKDLKNMLLDAQAVPLLNGKRPS